METRLFTYKVKIIVKEAVKNNLRCKIDMKMLKALNLFNVVCRSGNIRRQRDLKQRSGWYMG